jgi:hypothetical protein
MKKIFCLLLTLLLTACGTLAKTQCVMFQPGIVTAKYDKMKSIAVEESKQYGFDKLTTEIKPSKYNNFVGEMSFQTKTTNLGNDVLNIQFDHDKVCFQGIATTARPDTAIKAILDRYQHL